MNFIRKKILSQILGSYVEGRIPYFQAPIYFDYGFNTHIGEGFYANTGAIFLDCAKITIGKDVLIGPNV